MIASSPLIRRIRRHSAMATLFHGAGSPAARPLEPGAQVALRLTPLAESYQGGRVVMASTLPVTASPQVPEPVQPPAPGPDRVVAASPGDAPVTMPERGPTIPAPFSPMAPATIPEPPSVRAAPVVASPAPAQGAASDDTSWSRLQTIMRRHKEQEAAGLSGTGAAPVQRDPAQPFSRTARADRMRRLTGQPSAPRPRPAAATPTESAAGPTVQASRPDTPPPATPPAAVQVDRQQPEPTPIAPAAVQTGRQGPEATPVTPPVVQTSRQEPEATPAAPPASVQVDRRQPEPMPSAPPAVQTSRQELGTTLVTPPAAVGPDHQEPGPAPSTTPASVQAHHQESATPVPPDRPSLPSTPAMPPIGDVAPRDNIPRPPTVDATALPVPIAPDDVQSRVSAPAVQAPPSQPPVEQAGAIVRPPADSVRRAIPEPRAGQGVEPAPGKVDETAIQRMPLDAVWPVARQPAPTEAHADSDRSAILPPTSPSDHGPEVDRKAVQRALEQVQPDQPSASSVEVITPRRSRAAAAHQARAAGWGGEAIVQPATQTQGAEDAPPAAATAPPPRAETGRPTVDRPMDHSTPAMSRSLVETEIGDLPADLWTLLGEPPPPIAAAAPPVEPGTMPPQPRTTAQLAPAQPVGPAALAASATVDALLARPARAESGTRVAPAPRQVQRQVADDTVPAPDISVPTAALPGDTPADTSTDTSATAELDTDELARHVYAQLKRRLAVEWERLRRRS